jgi:hypothetical protein
MARMAVTLGAPVTEPHGKVAAKTSQRPTSSRSSAVTVDVSWCTVGYVSTWNSCGTRTVPKRAMRPRSFRSRSTIIRFSARSLGDACSVAAATRSSSSQRPRRMVPFMGRVVMMRRGRTSKNSSGDADTTAHASVPMQAW